MSFFIVRILSRSFVFHLVFCEAIMGGDALKSIHGLCAGVFDALHKKYLRTLFLTICGARDGPLIEEYICKRYLDFKALLRIIIHLLLVM